MIRLHFWPNSNNNKIIVVILRNNNFFTIEIEPTKRVNINLEQFKLNLIIEEKKYKKESLSI